MPVSRDRNLVAARFKTATINENARLKINVSFSNTYISKIESKTY